MQELTIVKDNSLIDNFVFNATEHELQILNYAVAVTNPYWDKDDRVYRISIPELVKLYGSKSNKRAWEQYRKALLRLQVRTYVFYKGVKRNTIPLIKMVTEDTTDNTYLEFRFSRYLQNRIQNLQGLFTQYDIKNIAMFSSRYAFMLYEMFKMNLNKCNESIYFTKVSVEALKANLDLSNKYTIFRNFRIKVLEIAKQQINKHSDINLDYQVIKTGRTPTHIKFTAKYKKKAQPKELETKSTKTKTVAVEHQTQLPLNNAVEASKPGFTEQHKETAKKHLTELKQKMRI